MQPMQGVYRVLRKIGNAFLRVLPAYRKLSGGYTQTQKQLSEERLEAIGLRRRIKDLGALADHLKSTQRNRDRDLKEIFNNDPYKKVPVALADVNGEFYFRNIAARGLGGIRRKNLLNYFDSNVKGRQKAEINGHNCVGSVIKLSSGYKIEFNSIKTPKASAPKEEIQEKPRELTNEERLQPAREALAAAQADVAKRNPLPEL